MERISELNTLIEYWKLQRQLAHSEVRREIAIRQQRSFEAELKSLTVRLDDNLKSGIWQWIEE